MAPKPRNPAFQARSRWGNRTDTMFALYLVGYAAVAGTFYWRAYKTAPIMEEPEFPMLTLWINPEMAEEEETEIRKAA